MKRFIFIFLAVFLAACSEQPAPAVVEPAATLTAPQVTPTTVAPAAAAPMVTVEPTLTLAPSLDPDIRRFHTADGLRGFLSVSGWIARDGEVRGVVGTLNFPTILGNMPEGVTVVIVCHSYKNRHGDVTAERICGEGKPLSGPDQALVPAGTKVTLLFDWAIETSSSELWSEGVVEK